MSETPAATVLWLLDCAGCEFWLDGGWGVDALIGRRTRPHLDVDIVLREADAPALVRRLKAAGFADVARDDTRACNFVLGAPDKGLIDFHLVRFDGSGDGLYGGPPVEGVYPAEAFTGRGRVLGRPARCMSVAFQIANHNSGYALRPQDLADMKALSAATGATLPARLRAGG